MNETKPVFDTTHRFRWLWLSVLTDEDCMTEQAMKCRLIFRSVEETLNGVDDFGIEHTPDTDRVAVVLLAEPIQEPIDRFGFRLKPFQSVAINPSQVCVLHTTCVARFFESNKWLVKQRNKAIIGRSSEFW